MSPPPITRALVPVPGPWAVDAACQGTPGDWWWPDDPARSPGLLVCARCPVLRECREHAMGAELRGATLTGIWGGKAFGMYKRADIFARTNKHTPAQLFLAAREVRIRIKKGDL